MTFTKKRNFLRTGFSLTALVVGLFFLSSSGQALPQKKVYLIELNDETINPVTAQYITGAIDKTFADGVQCLIIKMDTPGGLLTSTRSIVKKMLSAKVPVVVYIAPSGSRAGSAGVFITYASHIAAMAPSTNIGAAHPVDLSGAAPGKSNDNGDLKELVQKLIKMKQRDQNAVSSDEIAGEEDDPSAIAPKEEKTTTLPDDNPIASKILNDTVAFIKAIAKERNRNIDWAVTAVTQSASVTDQEALDKGIIDLLANDESELLEKIDGRVVSFSDGTTATLATKNAPIIPLSMSPHQKFFNALANPNIAYILMILGFYGLLFEVTHPGFGLPGILGTIFLILAFYSMQTLPTNYAGLALLSLGLVLLVTEAFVPGFGLFTAGGLVCMILGSLLLFDSVDPIMRISKSLVISFSCLTGGVTIFLLSRMLGTRRRKVQGGAEGLIDSAGEAVSALIPGKKGKVYVHGELWTAVSPERIGKGEAVVVESLNGLILKVKKK